ncbi:MAG: endolytic transglycosylase MltG [Cyanothece sp. SIO2G6]|nr:endolytic transglycosylase MltG [Cyanothece sp. SIO2G6]
MGHRHLSRPFFYSLVLPLIMGFCGWQGWLWWSWVNTPPLGHSEIPAYPANDLSTLAEVATTDTRVLTIADGTSAQQIGGILLDYGLIRSTVAWSLWTRWQSLRGRDGGFLAGTYAIASDASMTAIAEKIWQGDVLTTRFTIPEGWSMAQMGQYFEVDLGWFTAADFMAATREIDRDRYPWLPDATATAEGTNLEGFLYPSTYYIGDNPTPSMVVAQMLGQFEQTALPLYEQNRGQMPYSLMEWVTLASIVEREAVVPEERPTIAAVFARRLREGIPLATDPTVEYAFGIRQTPDRPLTYAEVGTPHPYNTYINVGLPPGAIAAPGFSSLEASLNPGETEFLFFMARFDGTHIFSRTLADHEAAKHRVGASIRAGEKPWEND